MKYLIVENFSGQAVPFIFPRLVDHVDMVEQLPYGKVLSAGFIEFNGAEFICSGGNAELNIKANPEEDAKLIAEALSNKN